MALFGSKPNSDALAFAIWAEKWGWESLGFRGHGLALAEGLYRA